MDRYLPLICPQMGTARLLTYQLVARQWESGQTGVLYGQGESLILQEPPGPKP